ncbi:MAG: hypothetical protein HY927_08455 [Elusimicrobia bacterium]|nr:hypothetical protein [Elusimicrobiota bacterium]
MKERTPAPGMGIALRVWWAFMWRFAALFMLPALLLSMFLFYMRIQGGPAVKAMQYCLFAYMIWIQIAIFRRVLSMDFGHFQVKVLTTKGKGASL